MADRAQDDGGRLLRAFEEEHAERREGQPLQPFTPVVPEAAAGRVGLGLGGERYEAAVRW